MQLRRLTVEAPPAMGRKGLWYRQGGPRPGSKAFLMGMLLLVLPPPCRGWEDARLKERDSCMV